MPNLLYLRELDCFSWSKINSSDTATLNLFDEQDDIEKPLKNIKTFKLRKLVTLVLERFRSFRLESLQYIVIAFVVI